jgi:hypothetical protein
MFVACQSVDGDGVMRVCRVVGDIDGGGVGAGAPAAARRVLRGDVAAQPPRQRHAARAAHQPRRRAAARRPRQPGRAGHYLTTFYYHFFFVAFSFSLFREGKEISAYNNVFKSF